MALKELEEFVGDFTVLGFDFRNNDLPKIREHLEVLHLPQWTPSVYDLKDECEIKLEKLAGQLELQWIQKHNALDDAWVTAYCYERHMH